MAENETQQSAEKSSSGGSNTRRYIFIGVLSAVLIAGGIWGWNWYEFSQNHESTDNAQIEGHISPVIPKVEGYVKKIWVNDNEHVQKGQTLVTIDKRDFKVAVQKAKAELQNAHASYQDAKANLATTKAKEQQKEVALKQANTNFARQKRLKKDQSTTQQKYDDAMYTDQAAQADLKVAQKNVQSAKVNVQKAKAQIQASKADLHQAKLQLSYTDVKAPISGLVSQKNVEDGQLVRSGQSIMAIANDSNVWVVANFKEGEIAPIKPGQKVKVRVDAYPDSTFKARVQSLAGATGSKFALLPPQNASGNFVKVEQRIPVKIVFTQKISPATPLKPGMNVEPTIKIH